MDGKLDYQEGTVLMNHPANSVYQQVRSPSPKKGKRESNICHSYPNVVRCNSGHRTHERKFFPHFSAKVKFHTHL